MQREEDVQQVAVADDLGIERDLGHFDVPGPPAADILVGRVCRASAHVSRADRLHSLKLLNRRFHTPEASAA